MNTNASGRSALIVAVGLLVLLVNPVTAATGADESAPDSKSDGATTVAHRVQYASHHRRHDVHRKSHAIAQKADDRKAATAGVASDEKKVSPNAPSSSIPSSSIPPSIANANAQMLLAGVQLSAAAAIPSGVDVPATASGTPSKTDGGTFVVAADQLNDVDRTLQEGNSTSAPAAATSGSPSASSSSSPVPAAVTMTNENSAWDQTSLIGKIFIGFGALLTMASAARMFIG